MITLLCWDCISNPGFPPTSVHGLLMLHTHTQKMQAQNHTEIKVNKETIDNNYVYI